MLLTVGGSTNSNISDPDPTTSIQLYNPTNNEWTNIGDLPQAIYDCYCTVLSGELLILGGLQDVSHILISYQDIEDISQLTPLVV